VAGTVAEVFVNARDDYGNNITQNADRWVIEVDLLWSHNWDVLPPYVVDDVVTSESLRPAPSFVSMSRGYFTGYLPRVAGEYLYSVSLLTPGGTNASFFDKRGWALQIPQMVRVDANFEHEYGTDGPGPPLGHDYWYARWDSFLLAPYSEEFTFTSAADDGIRLFLDDVLVFDTFTGFDTLYESENPPAPSSARGKVVLEQNRFYRMKVEYIEVSGTARVSVTWESATQVLEPIPPSALHRKLLVSDINHKPTIVPAPVSPSQCLVRGESVRNGIAAVPASFDVIARDEFGNVLLSGGLEIVATAVHSSRQASFAGTITDHGNGLYTVSYIPLFAGSYILTIAVNPFASSGRAAAHKDLGLYEARETVLSTEVEGSPFILDISDGDTFAAACSASGSGLASAAAGTPSFFTIQAKDVHENVRSNDGDVFLAELHRNTNPENIHDDVLPSTVFVLCSYTSGGRYECVYTVSVSGEYAMQVTLGGEHILGSPFAVVVKPTFPYAPNCKLLHHLVSDREDQADSAAALATYAPYQVEQWKKATLVIRSFDRFGNPAIEGGDSYVVRIYGGADDSLRVAALSSTPSEALDRGDGTYLIMFNMDTAGDYRLDIQLASDNAHGLVDITDFSASSGGGLTGQYFASRWMQGEPGVVRIDPSIAFNWGEGAILPSAADLVSVRWQGYLKATLSDTYMFHLDVDDEARLVINGEVLIDCFNKPSAATHFVGSAFLKAGVLNDILLEYREHAGDAFVFLSWSSPRIFKQIIPPSHLFASSSPIDGSPFSFTVRASQEPQRVWKQKFQYKTTDAIPYTPTPTAAPVKKPTAPSI
jgi:hypothetical protein